MSIRKAFIIQGFIYEKDALRFLVTSDGEHVSFHPMNGTDSEGMLLSGISGFSFDRIEIEAMIKLLDEEVVK